MGLMKKLTSALVASSLVLSLVGSAFAAYTPGAGEAAGTRMQALGIINGRPGEGLALNSEITRAELVTTIVRAFGQEQNAKYLMGSTIFPDTASHWASGNIAMAVKLVTEAGGDAIGMPDGTFAPDVKLTPAQAVAFLMKFVGLKADATKAWPNNYLDVAAEKGLITAEDKALIAAETGNATRGLTFYLFDNAFYNYKLADGKTFYTKYVAPNGPTLTMNDLADTTMDSKVTVTGNVKGAVEVYVGSTKVTPDASGNFSAEFALPEVKAEPYTVTVTAIDIAGNRVEKSDTIARVVGKIASIEASAITVAAGATVDVAAAVKDEAGNVMADAAITGESAVGTYAAGKFTAGEKAGTGKLTLKSGEVTTTVDVTVTAGALAKVTGTDASVAPGKSITLTATDAYGNTVTGVTFSEDSADALIDGTTFVATKAGSYTVKATKDGVTVEGTIGVYGDVEKLVISAPANMVGNDATEYTVTVTAVDGSGNVVLGYERNVKISGMTAKSGKSTVAASKGVATFTLIADNDQANSDVELIAQYDTSSDAGDQWSKNYSAFVSVDPQVATAIEVDADEYLPTNDRDTGVEVTVNVLDQKGENMVEGAWEVSVALTGPASLDLSDDLKKDDIAITTGAPTITVYPNEAGETGDVTVAVSFTGLTAGQDTLKARFAQDPKAIVITTAKNTKAVDEFTEQIVGDTISAVEYSVQVVDKNGVPVSTYNGDLDLVFDDEDNADFIYVSDDGTTGSFNQLADNDLQVTVVDGKAKFFVNSQIADTLSVKLVDNDSADTYTLTSSAASTMTFTPGAAYSVGMEKDALSYLQKENAEVKLTAQVYDRFGNAVAKSDVEVTFHADTYEGVTLNGSGKDVKVKTDANGVATVTALLANYVDTVNVSFTSSLEEGFDYTGKPLDAEVFADVDLTGSIAVPASINLEIVKSATTTADRLSSVEAGGNFFLKATVKDNYGRTMKAADLAGFAFSITDSNANWAHGATLTDGDNDGVYFTDAIVPIKAESLTMTVKVTGLADAVSTSRSISVKAGAVAQAKLVEADSEKKVDVTAAKLGEYTLQLADQYGNYVASSAVTQSVTVKLETTTAGGAFRNANGKNIEYLTIASGRTSAKFFFIGDDLTGKLTFTAGTWADADKDGVVDAGEWTELNAGGTTDTTEYTLK